MLHISHTNPVELKGFFLVFLFKCEAACMKQVFTGELAI